MPPLHHYIEEQEKKFAKQFPFIPHADNFGSDGSVIGGSDIAEEVKSFHTASLNGLVDMVEKWVNSDTFKMDIKSYLPMVKEWKSGFDVPFDHGYKTAKADLLTFLGRDTK